VRAALLILVLATLTVIGWGYRGIWAVDPLSIPAKNKGWGDIGLASNASKLENATFAAGCFWGVEGTFRKVPGVIRTRVGYTGGQFVNPQYLDVASRRSGHAEAIDIEFDPAKVSYQHLLEIFFDSHDPTSSTVSEYRSAIFYHSSEQKDLAEQEKRRLDEAGEYVGPIVTEISAAQTFYPAEEYHQRYYESRGSQHVCRVGDGKKVKTSVGG
jgi:peptide-methionine (S)-S-oxide reductase